MVRDLEACTAQVEFFQVMIMARVRWSLGRAVLEVREEEVSQLGLWVLPRSSTLKPPDTSRPGRNTVSVVSKESSGAQTRKGRTRFDSH